MALKIEVGSRVGSLPATGTKFMLAGNVTTYDKPTDKYGVIWEDEPTRLVWYERWELSGLAICRNCLWRRGAHDEQTGKCLFGAGEWR